MPTTRHRLLVPLALFAFSIPTLGVASSGQAASPAAAPTNVAGTAPDAEILRLREAAWRAWFAGDAAALREMLPPEFIGIDMGDEPFSDLATTLEQAQAFSADGGRLVSLEFPETRAQQFGDVVVLYGRFRVVLESKGTSNTYSGRLTEVFVRRAGRWWHPGWHLDLASTP
jgi:hypothetical protein